MTKMYSSMFAPPKSSCRTFSISPRNDAIESAEGRAAAICWTAAQTPSSINGVDRVFDGRPNHTRKLASWYSRPSLQNV